MNEDRVVLITGGARRIGAHICRVLHDAGMRLVIHYRGSRADAEALQRELLSRRSDSVALVSGDLLHTESIQAIAQQAASVFGRIDVLINNASSFYPTPISEATEAHWEDLIGTNVKAPFFVSQALASELRKNSGCIVNIADIHGERPMKNHPIYSIAKAGNIMLTRTLARELGPEIRVNGVAPGAILWPENELDEQTMRDIVNATPLQTTGDPEDIARTVLFLIRDARFITGQVIAVCGGRSVVL